jgi:cytochrome c556
MWRLTAYTAAVIMLLAGAATSQTKITKIMTFEDYQTVMKSNVQAGGAMTKALEAGSYPEARKVLASLRQNFVALDAFWAERKREDAISIVKQGLTQIDAMDKLLASNADLQPVLETSQEFGRTTCAACHTLYREGTAKTGFGFKPGVFDRTR